MERVGVLLYLVGFDTETELAEAGCATPRNACLSIQRQGQAAQLFGRAIAQTMLRSYLADHAALLIGHNAPYDLGGACAEDESTIPLVFTAYEAGRIRDTSIRQKLIDIRKGRAIDGMRHNLAELASAYLKVELNKGEDSWRYWYGDLMHIPTDRWPAEARRYAMEDASSTLAIFERQQGIAGNVPDPAHPETTVSPDEILQTRADWCLFLMKSWGFRTDPIAVAELKANLTVRCAEAQERLLRWGLCKHAGTKKAPKVSKDMEQIKARVVEACKSRGVPVPMTEPSTNYPAGQVCTDKDTLIATGDPQLKLLAESGVDFKMLSTSVPRLEEGTKWPVQPGWNTLVRTGRTSCGNEDDPGNWQNPNRKGGVRECVIARPGHVLGSADWAQIELCTLAQTFLRWFGESEMAKSLQAGRDLHLDLAVSTPFLLGGKLDYTTAAKLKKSKDPEVMEKRQFAKAPNFGLPGGLGPDTFIAFARGYGLNLTREEACILIAAWKTKWPETRPYFARIAQIVDSGAPIQQLSGRLRGGCTFTSAANTMFQGAAADGAKMAMWLIALACYVDETSPLFGSRPILLLHDEFIIESPEDVAAEATDELARIMVEAMQTQTPDIPIVAEPTLMRRWYKEATEVRDPVTKKLLIWEPKEKRAA